MNQRTEGSTGKILQGKIWCWNLSNNARQPNLLLDAWKHHYYYGEKKQPKEIPSPPPQLRL